MKHLGPATTLEIDGNTSSLLVPLGATEQHGPHLPLNTDSLIAVAWAEAVANELPAMTVAPLLPFGSSGEHQTFAGTLSIGGEVLRQLVVELARSAAHDFERIVFLSGHGGNFVSVTAAVQQLSTEGHNAQCYFPYWPERDDIDAHAGCTETSIMLHLAPQSIRADLLVQGQTRPASELIEAMRSAGVASVSSSGVLGDPTIATPELGRELFTDLVARTVHALS